MRGPAPGPRGGEPHAVGRLLAALGLAAQPPPGLEVAKAGVEITLTAEENAAFQKSAAAVRELVEKLKL